MAIAYFKHTPVGKATQAEPYTAAANARYIMRSSATIMVHSERMPRQYHAVQRYLVQHEDAIRKNGRVCDKFIIAVPRELSPEAAHAALRRFGHSISDGKAPFLFTLQDWDTGNPHAHFIFIDRDPETGKRVFRTSDRDSTERLKLTWETTVNEIFREQGIEAAIEFGPANDNARELERDGGEQIEPAPEPIPEPEAVAEPEPIPDAAEPDPAPEPEPQAQPQPEDAPEGEAEMAPVIERELEDPNTQPSQAAHYVRLIYSTAMELGYLREMVARRAEVRKALEMALKRAEHARMEAGAYQIGASTIEKNYYQAQERLKELQRDDGRLKGFRVKLLGFEVKSRRRREAEQALVAVERGRMGSEMAKQSMAEHREQVERTNAEVRDAREAAELVEANLRTYGTDREVTEAEQAFEETIQKTAAFVPPEEAREAYQAGELTEHEYRKYLVERGEKALLADLDEALGAEEDKSEGIEG